MSHAMMSGSDAPATGTEKKMTLPNQSATGASHVLILSSAVITPSWRSHRGFVAHYAHVAVPDETKVRAGSASAHKTPRGYCEHGAAPPNLSATNFTRGRSMILRGRRFGFALCALLLSVAPLAVASDEVGVARRFSAPLEIPHATNLDLDFKSRRRARHPDNVERSQLLAANPGLEPLVWPRNGDVRARLVTPELRRTPVVGWIASSLYRSRKDSGWCLEVDPGDGEYVVFYRLNLR
jgi:hypothetical protein